MDDATVRKFFRAADQRFTAAEWLLANGAFNIEAMYLAGYTVECALKALLLRRTPLGARQAVIGEHFRGRQGHDFESLKALLRHRGCTIPRSLAPDFARVTLWATHMRYEVGLGDTREARAFLAAAKRIRDWANRS